MVKVSISLPNNTQITLESEESEVLHEVLGMVLRDLPRDLMQSPGDNNSQEQSRTTQNSISVDASGITATAPPKSRTSGVSIQTIAPSSRAHRASTPVANRKRQLATAEPHQSTPPSLRVEDHPNQATLDFTAFCRAVNPIGDMRRVVVATEGAARHFDTDGVTSGDLERLFDLVGWRWPGNFTQTLRNTARAKFGWLERIPGRAGRYAVTDLGRSLTQTS